MVPVSYLGDVSTRTLTAKSHNIPKEDTTEGDEQADDNGGCPRAGDALRLRNTETHGEWY